MLSVRSSAIVSVSLCLMLLLSMFAVSHRNWPNSRRVQMARAAGRYHAYKKDAQYFKRAANPNYTAPQAR
jgi:hypothetical protein